MKRDAPYADAYDRIWEEVYGDMQETGPVHRHMRRLVGDLLSGISYESVLDVGCGAGHNVPLFRAGHPSAQVTGIDVSAAALGRAREKFPDLEFVEADVESEPLEGSWDLVFCGLLLEHLRQDEKALEHMRAMASHHLVIVTIAGDFERYRPWETQVGHVRNYRVGELEAKLEQAGFTVSDALYWGFPFYSPMARRLQNRVEATAKHGAAKALAARALYLLFWLNLRSRGDLLIVHATAGT